MSTPPPLLALDDVACGHGRPVLHHVTITLHPGQAARLTGPTCSGKTVLLDAIAGLADRAGTITIAGHDTTTWPAWRIARHIAYAPQGRRVWPNLTVADHLNLTRTRPGPQPLTRTDVLDLFGPLRARMTHRADTLSGGEARMLCLARALLRGRPLLLLDEPTDGLAAPILDTLATALTDVKTRGTAIVFVDSTNSLHRLADHTLTAASGTIHIEQTTRAGR